MNYNKWQAWFILSCIWMLINMFVFMVLTPEQLQGMKDNYLYMFNVIVCTFNLCLVLYAGSIENDDKQ